jgi:hypothetical protein
MGSDVALLFIITGESSKDPQTAARNLLRTAVCGSLLQPVASHQCLAYTWYGAVPPDRFHLPPQPFGTRCATEQDNL